MAPWWLTLILFVGSFVLTALLTPKINQERQKPAGLGDFNFPTATEGRVVPVIFGRVRIGGPNVAWYGHLKVDGVYDKISKGIFGIGGSERILRFFRYYVGMQFALCRGPIDNLVRIWIDDEEVFDTLTPSGAFSINKPKFFGGEGDNTTNRGGITGNATLFPGTESQAVASYLTPFQNPQPAYRGTAYITWEQGYIGNSPTIPPWAFELERYPNTLALTGGDERIGNSANPMAVLHEILTNDEWGSNIGNSQINEANLRLVAATLVTEGNGFAFLWDRVLDIDDLIAEIERQTDGFLFVNPITGVYDFKLARFDYTPAALEVLDESKVTKLVNFSRPSWDETVNVVKVKFPDPRKAHKDSYAMAEDIANQEIVKAAHPSEISFPGCRDHVLANSLAWRELRETSYPLGVGIIETDRSQYSIFPGDVRKWSNAKLKIAEMIIRVTQVDYGKLGSKKIKIGFVQDVYTTEPGSYSAPGDTNWVAPTLDPVAFLPADQIAIDAPYGMVTQSLNPNVFPRIMAMARKDSGAAVSYEIRTRDSATPGGQSGSYIVRKLVTSGFTPIGTLRAAMLGMVPALPVEGSEDIDVDPLSGETLDDLIAPFTIDDVNWFGIGVAVIEPGTAEEEWIVCQAIVDSGAGIQLENCYRGALDSPISAHALGKRVWFAWIGGAGISDQVTEGNYFETKLVPFSPTTELLESSAAVIPEFQVSDPERYARPLIPVELEINDVRMPSSASSVFATGTGAGFRFNYIRRQWRTAGANASVRGLDTDEATAFGPGDPNRDNLRYNWWIYDLVSTPSPTGRGDAVLNGTTDIGADTFTVLASALTGVGVSFPGTLRVEIEAIHDPLDIPGVPVDTVSRAQLIFDFDTT